MNTKTVLEFVHDTGNQVEKRSTYESGWGYPVRALAIAAEIDFSDARKILREMAARKRGGGVRSNYKDPMWGFENKLYKRVLDELGWTWTPAMSVGSGMKMHLSHDEIPTKGRLILRLSKYYVACIDRVIHDIPLCEYRHMALGSGVEWKCECVATSTACRILTRDGKRGVYGYWEDQRIFTPQSYKRIVGET